MLLRLPSVLCLSLALVGPIATAGCTGDTLSPDGGDGDAGLSTGDGDGDFTCDGTSAPKAVDIGPTDLDFVPMVDGASLPSWQRPQGGIGSRINVKISGFPEQVEDFSVFTLLTTRIYLEPRTNGGEGEEGGACGAGCGTGLACVDDVCRAVICDVGYGRFPTECLADGTLHIPEMSIRFDDAYSLEDLDGLNATLEVILEPTQSDPVSDRVDVIIDVGDFLIPSWWDETNLPG